MDYTIPSNWTDYLPALTFALVIIWSLSKLLSFPKNFPPGPWGLPFLGYAPFLGKKLHVSVANMRKKYGDLIGITLGFEKIVFLNSYTVIKEALIKQSDVFSIRPINFFGNSSYLKEHPGIFRNSGDMWADFRRFSLSTFRDFGVGKASLEPQIKEEIDYFLKEIESHKGQPADIGLALRASVTNVVCVIMTGKRYDYNDKVFINLVTLLGDHVSRLGVNKFARYVPLPLHKPFLLNLFGLKSPMTTGRELIRRLQLIIDEYEKQYEPGSRNNFIHAWFTEAEKTGTKSNNFSKNKLPGVLLDLFLAGSDTTSNSLSWSILYMMEYPEVQSKVQTEINEVIGKERTPSMSDQKLMAYTDATIMEVQRIGTIVPLSILHGTLRKTTVNGYTIPEGTMIAPNLWAVHNDPDIFPESDKFKPERFLTGHQELKKMEELIPFSMGKRQCMGESLARMELFLYFTSLLQRFTFKKVEGQEVDFDYDYAVVSQPKPQQVCAIIR